MLLSVLLQAMEITVLEVRVDLSGHSSQIIAMIDTG